jgi:hypothetical protein
MLKSDLHREGLARELVNRLQNLRKEKDFAVTDKNNRPHFPIRNHETWWMYTAIIFATKF